MPAGSSFGMTPATFCVLKTVPWARSPCGKPGSVQPVHGWPARVFDDCRFHRMRLHGECVIGPRQPNS